MWNKDRNLIQTAFSLGVLLANDFSFSLLEFGLTDSDFLIFSGILSGALGISATPANSVINYKLELRLRWMGCNKKVDWGIWNSDGLIWELQTQSQIKL